MPNLAVIDTPSAPPGWEDARGRLVRIVDPLGHAVAWLAPAHDGRCVGFAVRPAGERGTPWVHLFRPVDHGVSPVEPHETGCAVRCALAGDELGAARERTNDWRFVERDPTMAVLVATHAMDGPGDGAAHGGELRLRLDAALTDGTLAFALLAENRAMRALRLDLGLAIGLFAPLLRDAAGILPADLPGRALAGDATDRADIPPAAVARLGGAGARLEVALALITGVARLRYCAPGAGEVASLLVSAGGEPDGVLTLEAGETVRLVVVLQVTVNG